MSRPTGSIALSVLVLTLALPSCGDDPVKVRTSSCAQLGPFVRIIDNHLPSGGDHELIVSASDVTAGVERTYDIRGDNVGHTHSVTLTSVHFLTLRDGNPVTVVSSNNGPVGIGHDHTIELSCP
jgi:hypothetical protein